VRIVAEGLAGRSVNQSKESVGGALLAGNTVSLHLDKGAVELIGQAVEGLIELRMLVSHLLFGAIILPFQSFPATGQADNVLRVGVDGQRMGSRLNFAKGPDECLQLKLSG